MANEIILIRQPMRPEAAPPYTFCLRFTRLGEIRSSAGIMREKYPFYKFERIEKSKSPGGKDQMQCR